MNMLHEYALLIAVALPICAVVGLNLFLALTGERITLLIPGLMSLPKVALPACEPIVQFVESGNAPQTDLLERIAA